MMHLKDLQYIVHTFIAKGKYTRENASLHARRTVACANQ